MGPSQVIIAWCRGRKPHSAWRTNETQMGHLCSGVQQTTEKPTSPRVSGLPEAEPPLPAAGAVSAPGTSLSSASPPPGSFSGGEVAGFPLLGQLPEPGALAGDGLCPTGPPARAPGSWTPHGEGRGAPPPVSVSSPSSGAPGRCRAPREGRCREGRLAQTCHPRPVQPLDESRDLPGLSFQPCKVRVWPGPLCAFGSFGGQTTDSDPDRLIRQERVCCRRDVAWSWRGCRAQGRPGAWVQEVGPLLDSLRCPRPMSWHHSASVSKPWGHTLWLRHQGVFPGNQVTIQGQPRSWGPPPLRG